jgi:hypothetical protein
LTKKKKSSKFIIGSVAGLFVLRTLRLAYQRTRLQKVLESIVGGDPRAVSLNQDFVTTLPKTSFDFRGRATEPLNFILLGEAGQIERAFSDARWHEAVPITASNWAKAFWSGLRDSSYPDGPMTPYYLSTTPQDMSFQQETKRRSFRQRHHVRFWRTKFEVDRKKLWLGMASYDRSLRLLNGLRFPYHHIDPDLDAERELIVGDLLSQGGKEIGRFNLGGKLEGKNDHHEPYFTDGKIVVVDLSEVKT